MVLTDPIFLESIASSKGFGVSPRWESNEGALLLHHVLPSSSVGSIRSSSCSSRASFLQTSTTGVAAFLLCPSVAVARTTETTAADKLQAGFDSLNKEVSSIDRVLTKEAKKMDRAVTKKTKPMTKQLNKEVKKANQKTKKVMKKVNKETKVVMKKVDKKTEVVTSKAKTLGRAVETETKALIGGGAVVPQPNASGIDVSKLKVCKDAKGNCL
eukprot:CAMPEP_0201872666 /NCGR_PEP_ID=MMETSP0902-20130614/5337_1 /ASSEMBLY_ACC=CAM_ASM_000551 /TAXON_ID=420261 /ORGANISM="Thalassiosira antarctica, Strain CCMP982" /LENGTH=212 /DNA_ID=CAMNT_0048399025 /DNA_START=58 /DNA_END=700 /DNA_ORIENTATION=+